MSSTEKLETRDVSKRIRYTLITLISYIVILTVLLAIIKLVFDYLTIIFPAIISYIVYANTVASLFLGILIALKFSDLIYWNLRLKLPHSEAASVRSAFKILGIVAVVVTVVGSNISATAAAALGGFAGIVAGFATQQTLSQAVSGIFIALSRPFKVHDKISISGQKGIVYDITTFYTILETDSSFILIPNNMILNNIITKEK
jgi:Small-conductance mechanosensitive channel